MSELIGYEQLLEAVEDSLARLRKDGPEAEFASFGVDYRAIMDHIVDLFGENSAYWVAGFHSALCLAMREWEYRIPKLENE